MKSLSINIATYNMLEFIANKSRKNVAQFLDALAIQEYSEYQDKPFKQSILKKWKLTQIFLDLKCFKKKLKQH